MSSLGTFHPLTPIRFFIDTWQYFLHRLMHMNKFLYKHLHSVHHRLYVPYSFGALYNHPVEGFLLDTLGSVVAQSASFMSTRQAIFLFTFATFKTVDDHCGYAFPFDPLQLISGNNSDYHDIHHQVSRYASLLSDAHPSSDHRTQVQLFAAILCALGRVVGNPYDARRSRPAQSLAT
jgi:sterol desaturase/sphingolipid hydroxylase (fatty acid hydroxylase superfamily)